MAESEEELKSLLMKVKVESEKVGLKLNIHKMKIMASGPITSWEIGGETVETVSDFIMVKVRISGGGERKPENCKVYFALFSGELSDMKWYFLKLMFEYIAMKFLLKY